jgi:hypothetical protein
VNKKFSFVVLRGKKRALISSMNIFVRIGRYSKKSLNFKIKTIKDIPTYSFTATNSVGFPKGFSI